MSTTSASTTRSTRSSRTRRFVLAGAAVVGVLAIAVVSQWADLAQTDPLRHAAATETWALGNRFLPLGSGVGSFVQIFAQAAGPRQFADWALARPLFYQMSCSVRREGLWDFRELLPIPEKSASLPALLKTRRT